MGEVVSGKENLPKEEIIRAELVKEVKKMKMPHEMTERVVRACDLERKEKRMGRRLLWKGWRRSLVMAASAAFCFCLFSVGALAVPEKLEGFFRDVVRWDGAVTGTYYEQGTDEVEMKLLQVSDVLVTELMFVDPDVFPYRSFERFGIASYSIMDEDGNRIAEKESTEMKEIVKGKVEITIPLNGVTDGAYRLVVRELVGSSKAEQPLVIGGSWECEFVK